MQSKVLFLISLLIKYNYIRAWCPLFIATILKAAVRKCNPSWTQNWALSQTIDMANLKLRREKTSYESIMIQNYGSETPRAQTQKKRKRKKRKEKKEPPDSTMETYPILLLGTTEKTLINQKLQSVFFFCLIQTVYLVKSREQ